MSTSKSLGAPIPGPFVATIVMREGGGGGLRVNKRTPILNCESEHEPPVMYLYILSRDFTHFKSGDKTK